MLYSVVSSPVDRLEFSSIHFKTAVDLFFRHQLNLTGKYSAMLQTAQTLFGHIVPSMSTSRFSFRQHCEENKIGKASKR